MANVLGELFGEIAESIRSKTGDTATMKPAQFPEKISAIKTPSSILPLSIAENGTYTAPAGVDGYNPIVVEVDPVLQDKTITENGEYTADSGFDGLGKVTVEVAGSGGGSLPAGLYWEHANTKRLSKFTQRQFTFNGDIYLFSVPYTGSGSDIIAYKLTDGDWINVVPQTRLYTSMIGGKMTEYDGKLHLFTNKIHYVFDGTSFTRLNDLPENVVSCVVFNGQLLTHSNDNEKIYVWDKSADAWNLYAETGTGRYRSHYMFVYNGELYSYLSKNFYKLTDGKWVHNNVTTEKSYTFLYAFNGVCYLYHNGANNALQIAKYDPSTNLVSEIGKMPFIFSSGIYYPWSHDNKLRIVAGDNTNGFVDLIAHEIESTD